MIPATTHRPLLLPAMHHIGIVVLDAERTAADYENQWGYAAGPPHDLELPNTIVGDEEMDFSARYVFVETGTSLLLELIQPLSVIGPYTDFLLQNGEGVHHFAYFVDDLDDRLHDIAVRDVGRRMEVAAQVPGHNRFVYVSGPAPGPYTELIEVETPPS